MLMPLFEKKYVDYLTVHKIPIGPNQMDPNVFSDSEIEQTPALLPSIHAQITRDLEQFTSNQPQRVKNYYLVGPACKPGSKNRTGELRVIIELNKDIMDVDVDGLAAEEIMKYAKSLSGKLAIGTARKINYIPTVRPIEETSYEGIYDIPKFRWVRTPNGVSTCSQP
jgi:hypothetical protein